MSEACDSCGESVSDPLARTIRLTVDRSQVDSQRLCPGCFADWIERYRSEMQTDDTDYLDDDDEIIVD